MASRVDTRLKSVFGFSRGVVFFPGGMIFKLTASQYFPQASYI